MILRDRRAPAEVLGAAPADPHSGPRTPRAAKTRELPHSADALLSSRVVDIIICVYIYIYREREREIHNNNYIKTD